MGWFYVGLCGLRYECECMSVCECVNVLLIVVGRREKCQRERDTEDFKPHTGPNLAHCAISCGLTIFLRIHECE